MRKLRYVSIVFFIIFSSCVSTTNLVTPKSNNIDGIIYIENTESSICGDSFIISYSAQSAPLTIKFAIFGSTSEKKKIPLINRVYNTSVREQKFPASQPLSAFDSFWIVTTNGKILNQNVTIKDGNVYIDITDYDSNSISRFITETNEKIKKEQQEKEQQKFDFYRETFKKGEELYNQKIATLISPNTPVIIKSYGITMDSAKGIEVDIDFYNASKKTLKYVDFEVTPYNRVDDVTYSTIDHVSTKIIQAVDYIEPSKSYKAHFQPVWYNNTIAYIKINSVKVTFKDGTTKKIENAADCTMEFEVTKNIQPCEKNDKLSLHYNVSENDLYIETEENGGSLYRPSVTFYFETNLKSYETDYPQTSLNDTLITRKYDLNDVSLAGLESGFIKNFSDKQIALTPETMQWIRDFACIRYYVQYKDKGIEYEINKKIEIERMKKAVIEPLGNDTEKVMKGFRRGK